MSVGQNIEVTLDKDVKLIRESGNTDAAPEESKLRTESVVRLNVEYYYETAKIIEGLQKENSKKKIEDLLTKLLSAKDMEEGKETSEFISTVLHLFNAVLRETFFKTFLQRLFKKTQTPTLLEETGFRSELAEYAIESNQERRYKKGMSLFKKMFDSFAIDLQGSIIDSLEHSRGFEKLLEATQKEFENLFSKTKMQEDRFISFSKIFCRSFVYEIEESLRFIQRSPETLYVDDNAQISLGRTAYTIKQAFETIKDALKKTQDSRGISIHRPIPKIGKVSKIESLNPVLKGYLLAVMQNTLQGNPLDQLANVLGVNTIKSKSTRRYSTEMLSVRPLERRSSLPSISGESILLDMGDRGQQIFFTPKPTVLPIVTSLKEEDRLDEDEDKDKDKKNYKETFQVVYGSVPRIRRVLKICPTEDQEKFAALCVRNPFVEGINDGRALHDSLSQILKLYPDTRSKMLPYLIVFDTVGGTIGGLIGRHAILNPKKPLNAYVRGWKAITDGTVLFVFSMGTVIQIYLSVYPSEDTVSNQKFWSELAPGPVISFLGKSIWDSISPATKDRWFPQDTRWRYVRGTVDGFLDFLYYGRIFDVSLLNFFDISGHPVYQWASSPLALLTTLIKRLTRYRETTNAVMTYLTAANFSYRLFKEDLLPNGAENTDISPILTNIYRGYWSSFFFFSSGFILRHGFRFTREFEGEPDVITRRVKVYLNSNRADQYPTINQEDYQMLVDFSQGEKNKEEEDEDAFQLASQRKHRSDATQSAHPSSPPPPITQQRDNEAYDSRKSFPSQSTLEDGQEDRKEKEERRLSGSTESALPSSGSPPIIYMQQRYNKAYNSREYFPSQSTASDPSSEGRDEEEDPSVRRPSICRKNRLIPCCPCTAL